jgi:hypothetical protein
MLSERALGKRVDRSKLREIFAKTEVIPAEGPTPMFCLEA